MNQSKKIKQILTNEIIKIEKMKKRVEKSLKKAPKGNLVVSKSNGVTQYFHKTEKGQKKGKYIEKNNSKLISALAQKEYDITFQKEIELQEKRLKRILKTLPEKELEEVYEKLTEAKKPYVNPYVLPDKEYVEQWLSVPYTGKIYKEEYPKYTTDRGEKVRSKSEKIIADKLNSLGIPYRYEYPLELEGYGTIYPDFTILDVSNRKEVYLEHFGMMDDPEYCDRAIAKIHNYARYGIILGKNLLLTFETMDRPVNTIFLEEMLKEFSHVLN